jgi:hypothetical protein
VLVLLLIQSVNCYCVTVQCTVVHAEVQQYTAAEATTMQVFSSGADVQLSAERLLLLQLASMMQQCAAPQGIAVTTS